MVRFLWKRAIKQHAAFIISMPSDRNGSKASLPHGFDVIFGPVVGIKRAVGGVHQFGGQGGWNVTVSASKYSDTGSPRIEHEVNMLPSDGVTRTLSVERSTERDPRCPVPFLEKKSHFGVSA